jgi:type III pantothenate kinase
MLLTVDVGNSHTVIGIFYDQTLIHQWRLKTDRNQTADDLAIACYALFQLQGIQREEIHAFVLCSVVPTLETAWLHFANKHFTACLIPPTVVSSTSDTGIQIMTDNPAELGADRIVNAVAAWDYFATALIVIDFGTAITFDCVSSKAEYLGGAIHPGIGISLDALAGKTAQLPRINLNEQTSKALGRNTVDAIRSGILHGFGGMIDRMVSLLSQDILAQDSLPEGSKVQVIATGGMAELIAPYSSSVDFVDPVLTLTGLRLIHERRLALEN